MEMRTNKPLPVKNSNKMARFGLGMLAGLAVGGLTAILTAPRSGRETRAIIRSRAARAREHIADEARKAVAATREQYTMEHGHAPPG